MPDAPPETEQIERLDKLAADARGYHDPVCEDADGDSVCWAIAELGRLRALLGLQVTPIMAKHMEGNPYA